MNIQKVWFITGASKGMGLEIVKTVLAKGDKVIATSRDPEKHIEDLDTYKQNILWLKLDITNEEEVKLAIEAGIKKFNHIDVIVNNAGYYLVGSLEEIDNEEFTKTINVNVFGLVNVIRNIMPYFREQKSGHIINIASNMGYIGYANTGSYNASKFAVIGLSEALAQEAEPFKIKVTVLAPGMFRTNFIGSNLAVAKNKISEYNLSDHLKTLSSFNNNQPGNPKKLAEVVYKITTMSKPPLHLPLGTDSYVSIIEQRKKEAIELEQWKSLSLSTDY